MIDFVEGRTGAWSGVGMRGREWRIVQIKTGWRLQFIDAGDHTPVNAGVFSTLEEAQADAGR
jgi:hypothetical protein